MASKSMKPARPVAPAPLTEEQKKEQVLLWRSVVDELKRMGAPPELIMAALSDKVAFTSRGNRFILAVPHTLAAFIDKHMAAFKPAFQQFLTSSGFENNTFNYVYTDEN